MSMFSTVKFVKVAPCNVKAVIHLARMCKEELDAQGNLCEVDGKIIKVRPPIIAEKEKLVVMVNDELDAERLTKAFMSDSELRGAYRKKLAPKGVFFRVSKYKTGLQKEVIASLSDGTKTEGEAGLMWIENAIRETLAFSVPVVTGDGEEDVEL